MTNATVFVESSGGDYVSLNAALAGESANLTANCHGTGSAGILTIQCGNFSDTTNAATGTGYTTSSSYYINIVADPADITASNTGKWSTDRYRLEGTGSALFIQENYTRITDLQITSSGNTGILISGGDYVVIQRTIVKGVLRVGIECSNSISLYNCLVYGCGRQGFLFPNYAISYAYNCTSADNGRDGFLFGNTDPCTIKNCISYDNGDGVTYFDFRSSGVTPTISNCASLDATSDDWGGSGNLTGISDPFVNRAGYDYHLAVGSAMIGAGTDNPSSGAYLDDIDGQTRVSTWDIGADEYIALGGAALPRRAIDGPFYGSLRGSVR